MALTDIWLRKAKPEPRVYKRSDGGGLHIQINPNGSKLWRLAFRYNGQQRTLSLGHYPLVSLAAARRKRDDARLALLEGLDPATRTRGEDGESRANFETIARAWYEWKKPQLSPRYARQILDRLQADAFPELGAMEIDKISPPMILAVLRSIEARGSLEAAKRLRVHLGQIFRYAIQLGLCSADPAQELRGALQKGAPVKHHAVVAIEELPQLLRDIDGYTERGRDVTRIGLQLASLTLLRTAELIRGEWAEVDLDAERPVWAVPPHKMKVGGRGAHVVPLSRQAVNRLRELRELTGEDALMFPGDRRGKSISNNTLLYALYRLGYHSRQTTHGFRRIASTILNEAGFRAEAIEKQLAHEERNKIRAAYNAAEYMGERRAMLQWYADFMDAIKAGGPVPDVPPRAPSSALLQVFNREGI